MSCISRFAVMCLVCSAPLPTLPRLSEATQPSASFVPRTHSFPLPHEHHCTTSRLLALSPRHLGGGGRGREEREEKEGWRRKELKMMNRYATHVWRHTLIEEEDDFVEDFHEVHIVITVLLYLDQQVQLRSTTLTEG